MAHDRQADPAHDAATVADRDAEELRDAMSLDFATRHDLVHGLLVIGAAGRPGLVPLGPGWFDSSFELETGLEVREGWPSDAAFDAWSARFARQAGGR